MYEALQVIIGTHPELDEFLEDYRPMDNIKCLTKFDFVIGVVSLYSLLHPLYGNTIKLQGRTKKIVQAYQDLEGLKSDMKSMRADIDQVYSGIFTQACNLA